MPSVHDTVIAAIQSILERRSATDIKVSLDAHLFDDLGLDSLEVAELYGELEDQLGMDPSTAAATPNTVGEIIGFYPAAAG